MKHLVGILSVTRQIGKPRFYLTPPVFRWTTPPYILPWHKWASVRPTSAHFHQVHSRPAYSLHFHPNWISCYHRPGLLKLLFNLEPRPLRKSYPCYWLIGLMPLWVSRRDHFHPKHTNTGCYSNMTIKGGHIIGADPPLRCSHIGFGRCYLHSAFRATP